MSNPATDRHTSRAALRPRGSRPGIGPLWLLALLAASSGRSAELPSSAFNLPGQARTRTCVPLNGPTVPLRFADGTPTGWFVSADDPSQQGGNHSQCPRGTAEMDAHEVLTNASGMKLYFHPGGGPSHYRDWVTNGQYGHIAAQDLQSPPQPTGDLNGKPATLSGVAYFITPTRFPRDMWYKPNVENGRSGSTYYTYGNPGYDKTGGQGDWTYINWSWVQNGGPTYPKNKCAGGGMVRALGRRDQLFDACAVSGIIGYSYGANNKANGRVTAIYGRAFAGPGTKGAPIYGWMPHSYQKTGELIVPCVRRADVKTGEIQVRPSGLDRSERMAWNLLHPAASDENGRDAWLRTYKSDADPGSRMELLTDLSRMDDAQTLAALLRLLVAETQARVREQTIALIGFTAASQKALPRVVAAFRENYAHGDLRERMRTLDVISNFAHPEAVALASSVFRKATGGPERSAAADAILKLAPRVAVPESLVQEARSTWQAQTPSLNED